jgi:DNA/RNA-binding domain of Phe-tRNA-synthetase-like protein
VVYGLEQGPADVSSVEPRLQYWVREAERRLADKTEAELSEVQAWRRAYSKMGLKPTQYRCASEALLRRLRKEGSLPRVHPLVDLCNALSAAYAVPVAAFDVAKISRSLEVRHAGGDEVYMSFAGEEEKPAPDEVIFADEAGEAHARRWANRQSGRSAVSTETTDVLIVAEAMHPSAPADMEALLSTLGQELEQVWGVQATSARLNAHAPLFWF